jgi:hypothetical protein
MGDSFFAEIVLNDGTKTSEVEQSLLSLKSSLGAEGIDFDPRVAAEWSLESIEYAGICRAESGGIRLERNLSEQGLSPGVLGKR